jgi:ribosomal protein S18 acetylase RimI-like enzyme
MTISIIDYKEEHQAYFEQFNRAWIEEYFWMEARDEYTLTKPEEAIIQKGGAILVGRYGDNVAGVVGISKLDDETFELTKMAVGENFRRKGIAEALTHAALAKAKNMGAEKVILFSQTGLVAAINLYRKLGFKEVPLGSPEYERSDIKMELWLEDVPEIKNKSYENKNS